MSRSGGQSLLKFMYNADGIRTNKIVDGADHVYTLNGTQIVSEAWGNYLLIYLYDESGAPIGMQYRTNSYAANVFDTFYFEKNLQGDIIAVYNADGDRIGSYIYDAWGNFTVTVESTNTILESKIVRIFNPFRYRGYYYDTETGLYYLQSRYYNPAWGRFLNADGYVNANGDLVGFNMYAYCSNNPVLHSDPTGSIAGDILSPEHRVDIFDPDSYGGGGGVGILPLFHTIRTIWSLSKKLFIYLSAQAAIFGATFSSVFSDSVASNSIAMEDALEDSASKRNDPEAIYIGIRILGSVIVPETGAMTFSEAAQWALNQSSYGKRANWGLYTFYYQDAEIMAVYLASMTNGEYMLEDPSKIESGNYEHFHTDRKCFGKYKHFHVWYGLPKP